MRPITKVVVVALAVAVTMSMCVAQASARQLRVSSRMFEIVFSPLEFRMPFGTVRCPFTFLGEFHEVIITKVVHRLIGLIRHVTPPAPTEPCVGGTATALAETLPWHLTYEGFAGTLPNITSMTLLVVGAAFNVREAGLGITCLVLTSTTNPARLAAARNTVTGVVTGVTISGSIPAACGSSVGLSSPPGPLTNLARTASITVTLI
jgi:hypothetical protein